MYNGKQLGLAKTDFSGYQNASGKKYPMFVTLVTRH